ncbi:MAG: hypothetical protein ACRCUT_09810 [Spirochaetota bacterium]
MKTGNRLILSVLAGIFAVCTMAAFSPLPSDRSEVEEYSLRFMKKAQPPCELTLIRIENSSPAVKRGILFTYASRSAKKAFIAGDFSDWEKLPMIKGKNGVWYYFLAEYAKRDFVRYKFNIDGICSADPSNPQRADDGSGSFVSIARPTASPESHQLSYRLLPGGGIEFRRYDENASFISIAGDFNNWNPGNDILRRDGNNIWRLQKKLPKGKFRYKFIVDGQWMPDIYNTQSASDGIGGVCSVITVK